MHLPVKRVGIHLLITILLTHPALAQSTLLRHVADAKTNTELEVTSLFSRPSLGGFHPVRINARNNQKIPHRFTLRFEDMLGYDSALSTTSEYSFLLKPGTSLSRDLTIPLSAQNGTLAENNLHLTLTGTMGRANTSTSALFTIDQANVLLSNSLFTKNGSALDAEHLSRSSSSTSRSATAEGFAVSFDPKRLPNDWHAFSGFDSLLLSDQDWLEIPPGQQNTILSWIRLGGQMIVLTTRDPSLASLRLPSETSLGSIKLHPVTDLDRLDTSATYNLITKKPRNQTLTSEFDHTWPLQKAFGEKSFNYALFVIILITFGILVAPINLFIFAKPGQRHRLFITTPLISLGTSLLLIILIIFQDGFGGNGKRLAIMEVRPDDNQNAAFIRQEQISRTGIITSPSFTLGPATVINPVPITGSRWARFTTDYNTSGSYNLQPIENGLAASGSWFQSRSEQAQTLSAVVPTRGRIEFTPNQQHLISSFDFPIEKLLFQNTSGQWFQATNLNKGQKITPTPIDPKTAQAILNLWTSQYSASNQNTLQNLTKRPNHYIATSSSAPVLETHPNITWQTTTTLTGPLP